MGLIKQTDRVYIFPYEEERDRPNLGYILGDRWSLAVDAGHSADHVREFYRALEEKGLPLPALTVLTHWHWDHTFGMHMIHGLSLANEKTNEYLKAFRDRIEKEGPGFFLEMHPSIRREYLGGAAVTVVPADMTFRGEMCLDPGGCPVRVFEAPSPHTSDCTLIEVPGEKLLFLGDADCGTFPDWVKDRDRARALIDTIGRTGAEICVPGHWIALTAAQVIRDLADDD